MEIALIVLGSVIVGLLVERYFYHKETNKQLHDLMLAVMSKNTNEYVAAKVTEKAVERPFTQPDTIPLDEATDEEFMKGIKT